MIQGLDGQGGKPDVVVYNTGLPKAACPPCHAGLAEAVAGAPAMAAMVRRVLAARPDLRFYWRSTTALCKKSAAQTPDVANRAPPPDLDSL